MKKPKLAAVLKAQLRQAGLEGGEELAHQMGVPASSLRSWFARNQFPEPVLPALLKLARMATDLSQMAEQFQFELTRPKRGNLPTSQVPAEDRLGLVGIFHRFDAQAKTFEKNQRKFGAEVHELFSAMRAGDAFFYLSLNLKPVEWGHAGWMLVGDAIQQAVRRGAFFVYVVPSQNAVTAAKELGIGVVAENWNGAWTEFCDRLRKAINEKEDSLLVERHVHKIDCDRLWFMVPEFKFAAFICKNPRGTDPKSFVLLPTNTANPAHLPLQRQFTGVFLDYVLKFVQNDQKLPQYVREQILA